MPALTDNCSLITNENRSRLNSKLNRQYQKVSEVNFDHKTIISYLKSHRLQKTLAVFTSQTQYTEQIQPITEILNRGNQSFEGNIVDLINAIKKQAIGKQTVSPQRMIIIEFLTYIWYCVSKKELNRNRLNILKDYIDKNGYILAEIPQLLPYFALPYFDNPTSHPLFKKIVTQQWKNQLVGMICQSLVGNSSDKVQMQWLNIIKDMVQICSNFYSLIPLDRKTKQIQTGYERVKQYKRVIQANKIEQDEKLNIREIKSEMTDFKDINNVKETLIKLYKDLQNKNIKNNGSEISKIYHKLQLQMVSCAKQNKDKQFAKELIRQDILLFNSNFKNYLDRQNLKLLQLLSAYYECRTYLQQHTTSIHQIIAIISQNFIERNKSDYNRQMIYICFDILQKAVIRRQIFETVINQKGFIDLLLKLFLNQKSEYLKGSKQVQYEITANTALFMQIIMHRKGRYIMASTILFQNLIELVEKMKRRSGDEVLEKAICSCIYLLLVEPHIRARAEHSRLKDKLLSRMMVRTNSNYENIVGYIIQRMSIQGQIQQVDSDQDIQKSVQYDQTIVIKEGEIIYKNEIINGKQQKQNKITNKQLQKKNIQVEPTPKQNVLSRQRSKKTYSKQKYSWKRHE